MLGDLEPSVVVWQELEIGDTVRAARDACAADGVATDARWIRHDAAATDADGYEWYLATGADDDAEWDVPADAPLLAMYTAAFDGTANAALLSHQALIVQNLVIGRVQDITDETVFLNSGPLFHIATFMSTNATLHHGGRNVFVRRADAAEMCAAIEAERCTHAVIMGPTLDAMIEHNRTAGHDLTSLWPTRRPERQPQHDRHPGHGAVAPPPGRLRPDRGGRPGHLPRARARRAPAAPDGPARRCRCGSSTRTAARSPRATSARSWCAVRR